MFCVFSGQGVGNLRRYLNAEPSFAALRDPSQTARPPRPPPHQPPVSGNNNIDGGFDDGEAVVDDDDAFEDAAEMVLDASYPACPGTGTPDLAVPSPNDAILSDQPLRLRSGPSAICTSGCYSPKPRWPRPR